MTGNYSQDLSLFGDMTDHDLQLISDLEVDAALFKTPMGSTPVTTLRTVSSEALLVSMLSSPHSPSQVEP